MSRRFVLAVVLVALTTGACGSGDRRAVQRRAPRPRSEHAANVAREVVDGEVNVVWSTDADGAPVAVAADTRGVVVTIDHERVGALDPYGAVLWATDLEGVIGAVPVLMNDRVIVPFSRPNGSGGCLGLDRVTGEVRWRYEAITTGGVAVAAAGTLALCVMRNGQTAGVIPEWGSPRWEFTFRGDVDSSTIEVPVGTAIAVDQSTGAFGFVARLGAEWQLTVRSIETGNTRFHVDLGAAEPPSAPAPTAIGFVGVGVGSGDFYFVSFDTREVRRVRIRATEGFDPASVPIRVDDLVIVTGRAGEVTAIDLDTARPRWTAHLVAGLRSVHPVVLGDALMLQTWTGELAAFRLSDGRPIPLPADPERAIAMLFSGGPRVVIAVGQDGDAGWIERWEAKPGR